MTLARFEAIADGGSTSDLMVTFERPKRGELFGLLESAAHESYQILSRARYIPGIMRSGKLPNGSAPFRTLEECRYP